MAAVIEAADTAAATVAVIRDITVAVTAVTAHIMAVIRDITVVAVTAVTAHTMAVIRGDTMAVIFLVNRFGAEALITRPDIIHILCQIREMFIRDVAKF